MIGGTMKRRTAEVPSISVIRTVVVSLLFLLVETSASQFGHNDFGSLVHHYAVDRTNRQARDVEQTIINDTTLGRSFDGDMEQVRMTHPQWRFLDLLEISPSMHLPHNIEEAQENPEGWEDLADILLAHAYHADQLLQHKLAQLLGLPSPVTTGDFVPFFLDHTAVLMTAKDAALPEDLFQSVGMMVIAPPCLVDHNKGHISGLIVALPDLPTPVIQVQQQVLSECEHLETDNCNCANRTDLPDNTHAIDIEVVGDPAESPNDNGDPKESYFDLLLGSKVDKHSVAVSINQEMFKLVDCGLPDCDAPPKDCDFLTGEVIAHGESITDVCFIYTCNDGELSREIVDSCCEGPNGLVPSGEAWDVDCFTHTCENGETVITPGVPPCCALPDGEVIANGEIIDYVCFFDTCNNGDLIRSVIDSCCLTPSGVYIEDGVTYSEECDQYLCTNGIAVPTFHDDSCCELSDGSFVASGETFGENCRSFTCDNGTAIDDGPLGSCCPGPNGDLVPSGDTWDVDCIIKICEDGSINDFDIVSSCCELPDGQILASGETNADVCIIDTCNDGDLITDVIDSCCLLPDGTLIASGDTFDDGCDVFECLDGNADHAFHDSSCCELPDGSYIPDGESTEYECHSFTCDNGRLNDDGPLVSCCQGPTGLVPSGAVWDVDCITYTCENGEHVSTPRVPPCCKLSDGEIIASGVTKVDECFIYSCQDGDITTTAISSCCLLPDGTYIVSGETFVDDCETFECNEGILNTTSLDSSCCPVPQGGSIPAGSVWTDACRLFVCGNGILADIGPDPLCDIKLFFTSSLESSVVITLGSSVIAVMISNGQSLFVFQMAVHSNNVIATSYGVARSPDERQEETESAEYGTSNSTFVSQMEEGNCSTTKAGKVTCMSSIEVVIMKLEFIDTRTGQPFPCVGGQVNESYPYLKIVDPWNKDHKFCSINANTSVFGFADYVYGQLHIPLDLLQYVTMDVQIEVQPITECCGGVFYADGNQTVNLKDRIVSSSHYPLNYKPNSRCPYVIKCCPKPGENECYVEVDFIDFELENHNYETFVLQNSNTPVTTNKSCENKDRLLVSTCGKLESNSSLTFCDSNPPKKSLVAVSQILMFFKTNDVIEDRGFTFAYSALDSNHNVYTARELDPNICRCGVGTPRIFSPAVPEKLKEKYQKRKRKPGTDKRKKLNLRKKWKLNRIKRESIIKNKKDKKDKLRRKDNDSQQSNNESNLEKVNNERQEVGNKNKGNIKAPQNSKKRRKDRKSLSNLGKKKGHKSQSTEEDKEDHKSQSKAGRKKNHKSQLKQGKKKR